MPEQKPMPGDKVRVRSIDGELVRRVVEVRPARGRLSAVVCITTDAELIAAHKEGREPITVGFRMEYVLEVLHG